MPVDKKDCYDMAIWYRSRFLGMLESGNAEDKANAEACKLGSQAWFQIAYGMFDHEAKEEFDLRPVIDYLETKWKAYCESGIPENEIQDAVEDLQRIHAENLRRSLEMGSEPLTGDLAPPTRPSPKDFKKRKPPTPTPPPAKRDLENLKWINPDSINEITSNIARLLGIEWQEVYIETSVEKIDSKSVQLIS